MQKLLKYIVKKDLITFLERLYFADLGLLISAQKRFRKGLMTEHGNSVGFLVFSGGIKWEH